MTSPRRKPCVCHTHTEKQALHNRSVKSPCSKTGAGEGGSLCCQWKEISLHSDDIRQSERPLNSSGNQCSTSAQGAEIKHQVALMADSHTHTRHKGNINYRRRHVRWRTIPTYLQEQFFRVNAGFRWMSYDHDGILISLLSNNWSRNSILLKHFNIWLLLKQKWCNGVTLHHFWHEGRFVQLLLQRFALCNHCG